MLHMARWRIVLVIVTSLLAFVFAAPNLFTPEARKNLPSYLPRAGVNLGLDLRGGSYLLLEVDINSLRALRLENTADAMGAALRQAKPEIRFTGRGVVGDAARVRLVDQADAARAMDALRGVNTPDANGAPILNITQGADGVFEARLTDRALRELSAQAATQSIQVLQRRIDPNGTTEVSILRQGENRIVVQAPGMSDPQMLRDRIGKTALMTFNLVKEQNTIDPSLLAAGRAPAGYMIVQPYPTIGSRPEVVARRPELTGEHLRHAAPAVDGQTGQYVMSFELDSQGALRFCQVSTRHVNERFAILLDDQVLTAPNIEEPICGGRGQIRGNFDAKSAQDLAIMLNAGALPAPLTVIEQRSIGAELGQDAIDSGAKAGIYATIAVIAFMVLAYGLFGVLACVALCINVVMIIAAMSVGGATLSLPGIAGLVLTIGMAVDANVLIYERMREEQAHGRGAAMAIDAGFSRALITIIDSHVTQIGVALILFAFGHGPVRGFAWTLTIGVVTSVITATLVTQYFIYIWFRLVRPKQLPI